MGQAVGAPGQGGTGHSKRRGQLDASAQLPCPRPCQGASGPESEAVGDTRQPGGWRPGPRGREGHSKGRGQLDASAQLPCPRGVRARVGEGQSRTAQTTRVLPWPQAGPGSMGPRAISEEGELESGRISSPLLPWPQAGPHGMGPRAISHDSWPLAHGRWEGGEADASLRPALCLPALCVPLLCARHNSRTASPTLSPRPPDRPAYAVSAF